MAPLGFGARDRPEATGAERFGPASAKIIDGRNRYVACQRASVEPRFRTYEGDDLIGFAVSMNLKRRHLTESQLGMIGAEVAKLRHGGDRKSGIKGDVSPSIAEAAAMVGVSRDTVKNARKVMQEGTPEEVESVKAGEVAVGTLAIRLSLWATVNCGPDSSRTPDPMCNLYSLTKGQKAILDAARAMNDRLGNLPPLPGIFPDYQAPIVRNHPDGRELVMARWGMPSPAFALKGRNSDPGVTNVRNVKSPHWRRWLAPDSRCLVPFTSFSENEVKPDGSRPPVWFAFDETRPLAFFAGIWTRWTSVRKVREGETTNDLFAFLTTEPNKEVGAIHPKAMPVILTTPEQLDLWMTAPAEEALRLQRPLPDDALRIVARGAKKDGVADEG